MGKTLTLTVVSDIFITLSNLRESVTEIEDNVAILNSTELPQNTDVLQRLTEVEQNTACK